MQWKKTNENKEKTFHSDSVRLFCARLQSNCIWINWSREQVYEHASNTNHIEATFSRHKVILSRIHRFVDIWRFFWNFDAQIYWTTGIQCSHRVWSIVSNNIIGKTDVFECIVNYSMEIKCGNYKWMYGEYQRHRVQFEQCDCFIDWNAFQFRTAERSTSRLHTRASRV